MGPRSPRESTSSPVSVRNPHPLLSFASLPPIYTLPTHFSNDELFIFEENLAEHQAPLTYSVNEAKIFLTKISQGKRAALELRGKGLWTESLVSENPQLVRQTKDGIREHQTPKRQRLDPESELDRKASIRTESTASNDESTESGSESPLRHKQDKQDKTDEPLKLLELEDKVIVVNVDWIEKSLSSNTILPVEQFIVYTGHPVESPQKVVTPKPSRSHVTYIKANSDSSPATSSSKEKSMTILPRTQGDAIGNLGTANLQRYNQRRRHNDKSSWPTTYQTPKLHRTTTSEFEAEKDVVLPEAPDWVKKRESYACRRSTPMNPPNAPFIAELQKIKEARILTLDEIGVRAYSTSIASIAAYPYAISHPSEILRLPGCDTKIASLWTEWYDAGDNDSERYLPAARDLENDETMKILKLFYNIWGVGADTARKFHFTKGWKDLDDIVEFGWDELNRVQQIGLKYYEEFQIGIPREEIEQISSVVLDHARKCRSIPRAAYDTKHDFECVVVGGYRRGKAISGDVDLILSHRDEAMTQDLVVDIIQSLEQDGWITHTLTLHTTTSDRGQQTLPYRSEGHGGHSFDSLDKGLCVWQNPSFTHPVTGTPTNTLDPQSSKEVKNPNIHRRIDIIVSPWRTVGCAILGWSGATTFERDIRRWVKKEKSWKFDSSGIRDRVTGKIIDFESGGETSLERERLVMEGLGIGWREPTERCTG